MAEAAIRMSDDLVEQPTPRTRVVIIDDHPIVRRGLVELVSSMPDLEAAPDDRVVVDDHDPGAVGRAFGRGVTRAQSSLGHSVPHMNRPMGHPG